MARAVGATEIGDSRDHVAARRVGDGEGCAVVGIGPGACDIGLGG